MNDNLWNKTQNLIDLETAIAEVVEDESLTEAEKDERSQQLFQEWLGKEEDWKHKLESAAYAAKCLEKEAAAVKSMIDDLKVRHASKLNSAAKLKQYILLAMQERGETKVKGKYSTIYQQSRQPVILRVEPEELPSKFQRVKVEPKLNELKKALKANNGKLPYCDWGETETSLVIRIK
ncbi:MAG TPA: siphovirus Gp157 family protein [Xenococcaceae cyanobacterium]